jgi:hypothetical protein
MTQTYSTVSASDSLSTGRGTWNDSLDTLRDNFSGTSAPTSPVVGQFYVDTTGAAERLEIRNADDDGWIILGDLDTGIHIPYVASYQFTLAATSYSTEVIAPLAIMPYNATLLEAKLVSTQTTASSGASKKWVSSIRNTTEGVDISSADLDSNSTEFTALIPQSFSLTAANTDLASGDVIVGTIQSTGSPTSLQHYTWTWQIQIARR